jgi:acyl carrier protein/tetratricopeptide (TPR) repeat protein
LDKALDSAEKGRSLFHGEEELDQEEIAIMGVAYAYAAKGELEEAVNTAQEAVALAQDTKHKRGEISALATLCEMHKLNDDLEAASEAAKAMRKVCQSIADGKMESLALYNLTSLHIAQGEGKLAVKAIESAVKICQKEGQKRQQVHMLLLSAEARLTLANEISEKASYDAGAQRTMGECTQKALVAVKDAVALAAKVGSASLQALAQHWNAQIMLAMSDTMNAMSAAEKARGFFQQAKDPIGEGYSLVVSAKAQLQEQNRPKAQSDAEEALALFKAAEDKAGEDMAQEVLSQCSFGMGGGAPSAEMMAQWQAMQQEGGGGDAAGASAVAVAAKPKGLDPEEVLQTVQEMAKSAIGLDDAVYLDSPLMDSGMDSLTAVSFRNGLQQNLGVKLPSSLMFDYPTMKEVANRIVELSLDA